MHADLKAFLNCVEIDACNRLQALQHTVVEHLQGLFICTRTWMRFLATIDRPTLTTALSAAAIRGNAGFERPQRQQLGLVPSETKLHSCEWSMHDPCWRSWRGMNVFIPEPGLVASMQKQSCEILSCHPL